MYFVNGTRQWPILHSALFVCGLVVGGVESLWFWMSCGGFKHGHIWLCRGTASPEVGLEGCDWMSDDGHMDGVNHNHH